MGRAQVEVRPEERMRAVGIIRYEGQYALATREFVLSVLGGEFGWWDTNRPDLDDIGGFYLGEKSGFWIALEDGKVVGTIAIKDYGKGRAYLKRMYVAKEFRGTGLARRMLDTALSYARGKGFREVFLATVDEMAAAKKFYSKNGFGRISKLPEGLPDFGDNVFYRLAL
ncbi:GNAT family N-acetyltransferase [Candidatus Micrarchaeota archaeon]|nr:GNAT family N-acetyltransferase [Candidatus Micrarchaeota archaeon]